MTRAQVLQEIKRYFTIKELVCPHTAQRFGETAWQFLDTELLETMLVIRKNLGKAVLVNNGGSTQRGLRCNICQIPKDKTMRNQIYLSSHVNGAGLDFSVSGMTAQQVRDWIASNERLLPYPIRLEKDVTWVHLDVYDVGNGRKINYFKA